MAEQSDWRGTPLNVGSIIIYPTAQGSSAANVIEGKIVEILPMERMRWDRKPPFKLKVEQTRSPGWYRQAAGKVVTITNTDRVTVIG